MDSSTARTTSRTAAVCSPARSRSRSSVAAAARSRRRSAHPDDVGIRELVVPALLVRIESDPNDADEEREQPEIEADPPHERPRDADVVPVRPDDPQLQCAHAEGLSVSETRPEVQEVRDPDHAADDIRYRDPIVGGRLHRERDDPEDESGYAADDRGRDDVQDVGERADPEARLPREREARRLARA